MNLANKLIENMNKIPKKVAIIQDNNKITYRGLYNKIASFKDYLEKKGIKKGDKILVLVPMSIELYITLFSLWSIGAIPCFMDAGFIKNGVKNNEFADINGIIGITKYLLYAKINKNLNNLKVKVNVNIIGKLKEKFDLQIQDLENDFPAIFTYTSGTTGKSKIACRTHEFLRNSSSNIRG